MADPSDPRVGWLRETANLYLDVTEDKFAVMVRDRSRPRVNGLAVSTFLEAPYGTTLFVYGVEAQEKVREQRVETIRNPKYVAPAPEVKAESDSPSADGTPAAAPAEGDAPAAEGGESAEPAPPPPPPEPEYIERVVWHDVLKLVKVVNAVLDRMPDEAMSLPAVFFIKTSERPVPVTSDGNIMIEHCEYGPVAGDSLRNLEHIVGDIFSPLLDPQLGAAVAPLPAGGVDAEETAQLLGDTGSVTGPPSAPNLGSPVAAAAVSTGGGGGGAASGGGSVAEGRSVAGNGPAGHGTGTNLLGTALDELEPVPLIPVADSVRAEFRGSLYRFTAQVSQALQQVSGDVHLVIPEVNIESAERAVDDYAVVSTLEAALEDWTKVITTMVQTESRKEPEGKGPLAEIAFWRQRNAVLSAVYEQLNMPHVRTMLKVLRLAESSGLQNFVFRYNELTKLYMEAKDNVKFLSTLERHFKNIASGNMALILDTLPSMMNALRMVWIISRHYNTDERMTGLMTRIADEIADKVALRIDVERILRIDAAEAIATIQEAKLVLDSWQQTYKDVRAKIEQSGTDHRWEFAKKYLFDRTNYMSGICQNLLEVATVVDEFNKFFLGPELKAVTDDPRRIDEIVAMVRQLTIPLANAQYVIFDRRYRSRWEAEMAQFRERVAKIEKKAKVFIDQAFQRLRSAEGAFDLLQRFQHIQSRDSIKRQMMDKFDDILVQASKELKATQALFDAHRSSPPVYKNYPPVAGAIAWARALYHRQKKPILRFRTREDLLQRPKGEQYKQEYLTFAKDVAKYCQVLYDQWADRVQSTTTDSLKQAILGPNLLAEPLPNSALPKPGVDGVSVGVAASAAAAQLAAATGGADVDAARMPSPPYYVNFSGDLLQLMREAEYLDRMGYEIPQTALNVTLQEHKFHSYVRQLNLMLARYHALLDDLKPVEANLLLSRLAALRRVLRPGFDPLNWNSLHIPTFLENCNKALTEFEGVLSQVRKSQAMLLDVADSIRTMALVKDADFAAEPIEITEFYERLEKNRVSRLESLVHKYKGIRPIMQQVEGFIANTDRCDAPELFEFYRYWERQFFNAITQMILTSMATFQVLLNIGPRAAGEGAPNDPGRRAKRAPLIRVQVTYNPPEVVITPALADVFKFLGKALKHIVESGKMFTRWKHGTCIEVEPPQVNEDEEPPDFSFYKDVFQNPHIIKMMLSLNQSIYRVFSIVNKYTNGWKRYDQAYSLWSSKKRAALDKLGEKDPSCVYFDTRLSAFSRLAQTVAQQPVQKDIDFMRVDCYPVAVAIQRQADAWRGDYGNVLRNIAFTKMEALLNKLNNLQTELAAQPDSLDSLKHVLNVVASVRDMKMDVELEYMDIQERYRTLAMYEIPVPEQEATTAASLDAVWEATISAALTKDRRLVRVKEEFREVTKRDVSDFAQAVKVLKRGYQDSGPSTSNVSLDEGVEMVKDYYGKLAECRKKATSLANAERLFDLPITRYTALDDIQEELGKVASLYDMYTEHKVFVETNSNMLWADLDINVLSRTTEDRLKVLRKLPQALKDLPTYHKVNEEVQAFFDSIPLIQSLKNEAMKERHWKKLMEVTGVVFQMNPKTFTLTKLFEMNLSRFTEQIGEIVNEAQQELKIEKELRLMDEKWKSTQFEVGKYTKNNEFRGYVLRSADDIKLELEDNMLNLQSMAGSRFVGIFSDQVREWEKRLNLVSECIEVWFVVQTRWQYLEGIFIGSEDIRLQLPEEARKFAAIDKAWKTIMSATAKAPNVVESCHADNRIELLQSLSERLDKCQKSLSEYLDTKRNSFPRFFFISDDELLSVLGTSDPTSIQVHLLKLFDNVKEFGFARGGKIVTSMTSSEGESYTLRTPVVVEGAVETWMTAAETEMRASLHQITKEGVFHYANSDRLQWIADQLGMVTMLGSQIWWTWETEDVFRRVLHGDKYAMKTYAEKLTAQLIQLVAKVREDVPSLLRKKLNTLLIVDVHARDIVDTFVRDSILDAREFAWESQLRFYWDRATDDVVIRQCTGAFRYGYEYMGLNGRLVITPLTDRCYMTLTQALTFNLGGSPAGPAGTGKTETVKDLAKNLALPCFVINCGEGLDYKAMGSIFSGLTQVGAWGCFDEFNRINIEVLSVVSAQLRAIQNALNYGRPTVDIGLGTEIKVNPRVGIFVTMNPGYAGRTELPDNLKALFRPVTMIVPDLLQICEIMLFSEGFEAARVLAKKMTTLYRLAREQLSKQYHYDFGLRALKSVLVMAGSLKREFNSMAEDLVLMRSLRDSNLPKFVYEDVPLFIALINDLFPGLDCPRVAYPALKKAIEEDLEANTMHHDDEHVYQKQVDKVVQLYEVLLTRHTTMIVGPTQGGKSVVLKTCQRAMLPAFNVSVKIFTLNPKAQTVAELYGVMDPATRDWVDGVLSKIFREINQPLPPGRENEVRWILYDGDVDAVWVENMNSVMDDNRLLTLPNGERIRLQSYSKMMMEVFDLQYASPATISRCGMVYVDPKDLGYRPYYVRWAKLRCDKDNKTAEKQLLMDLYAKYVPKLIEFVLEGDLGGGEFTDRLPLVVPRCNLSLVKQLTALLDACLPNTTEELSHDLVEGVYIFCIVWSIGSVLAGSGRAKFDKFLRGVAEVALPSGLLYDNFFDQETLRWANWQTRVPSYAAPVPFEFYRVLVPTMDSVLYTWLLDKFVSNQAPALLVGESGTAKSVTVQNYLNSLEPEKYGLLNINFSSRTTSRDVQTNIEDNVDKRSGHTYGPPVGKRLVIFIDDLNMPKVDTYGTQQPIALLHFLVGRGHMYDRGKDLDLRTFKDLLFVGAMGPPGGGRNNVDPRFVALFNVINMTAPTEEVLRHIYGSIITTFAQAFPEPIQAVCGRLTPLMLKFYNTVLEKLPPTPSKFHYIFNLRDLGRVYEGLCKAVPDVITNSGAFVRLFRNEVLRIFCDRLIDDADVALVNKLISDLIGETFPQDAPTANANPLLFGDYAMAVARLTEDKEDPRLYQDLGTYSDIRVIMDGVLEAYNLERKPMNLVLFEMALEHLTRIHRIIRMPRGNAMLVGVGGSGKQSLTRLATFAAGYKLFEISLSRSYGEGEFREDLKSLYKLLGQGSVVFLFTDAHVLQEGFLELINNMLTTGMVPALYEKDEKDSLCNSVRAAVKAAGIFDTNENCWNFYINRCRNNLHLVLAMSPSGTTLRRRCRNFPGLVSSTVIDWFFPWPQDALEKVATHFLAEETLSAQARPGILAHMVMVHQMVVQRSVAFQLELRRYNYVTPKNYLDYISNYRGQMAANKKKIGFQIKRLTSGLTKLTEAATAVDRMTVELKEKKVIVDAKTVDCEALIKDIGAKTEIANTQQAEAQVKQRELEAAARVILQESSKANEALEAAIPALEAAAEALDNLDKKDITEIKAFAQPPPLVMMVCMCVLHMRPTGREDEAAMWKGCKAMMNDSNFLQSLKTYDKDAISEKQIKKVKHYFKDGELTMERMRSVSTAGAGLLQWVIAILKYNEVAKSVEPLRMKVRDMEKQQEQSQRELAATQAMLSQLQQEIGELSSNYEKASAELRQLKEQAALMERRLTAASKLIQGLGSERTRWSADVEKLMGQEERLVGDCLLAASFLSYLGSFTFDYRQSMMYENWVPDVQTRGLPLTPNFKLEELLTADATVQQWVYEGLPADQHSVMNGILTTQASRFPLCIDPQQQAVTWIKNREGKNGLTVATMLDGDFMRKLELAVQYGRPFLFEAVDEELDPMIDPILEKNTFMEGQQAMIKLGDKIVEWDANFRLYLTSKLANPHYSPEIMGKTMIINYSVTMSGLANQLLNVVVGHERPDLEEQFKALVDEMSQNTQLLVELENSLLQNLASSTGNILDNAELISTLEETKTKAVEISGKLEQATFTKADINKTRANYYPAAKRASILFFAMSGMSNIMKMYEISLGSFLVVFKRSLIAAKRDALLEARLRNILNEMTQQMYDYMCLGIFERHKLMFSFQMTLMIMDGEGELVRPELDFFLKGDTSLEGPARARPHAWMTDAGWKDLLKLPTLKLAGDPFATIVADLDANVDAWKAWYDLETPESDAFPGEYQEKLSPFQRLMLIRCLRPDRSYSAVKLFVMGRMGEKYVQPPVLDYNRIFLQSTPTAPVVFVLSPGADPQADIQALGIEKGFTNNKFKFLALGQGQAANAEAMLEAGYSRGHWVLLSNCHLLISWLKVLEKLLQNMVKPHPDFRLWLTTDPTDRFPLGILQRSLKVVTEPPDGLKMNMRSLFAKITPEMLEECPHWSFRPLVYGLCFLHAVLLERRKFGKIGWNVSYDFNESDFNISRRLLALYLTKAHQNGDEIIPWGSLKYLIGDAMYGGRVSDDFDRRVLVTYLHEYMGDFLFDDHQQFYFSQIGYDYVLPPWGGLDNYTAAVEALPLSNGPAVFGLHPNAEIGYYTNASKRLWVDLIDLQPRASASAGGVSREQFIANVVKDVQAKIPEPDDIINLRKRFTAGGAAPSPTQIVLLQELERWNALVVRMTTSLLDMSRALVGEIGMSDALEDLSNALYNGFIPAMWRSLAPATQKPLGSWMGHFQSRYKQYQHWIGEGEPIVMWLSGLHIPESYLTALVQMTCRRKNWPLDKSTLYTKVTHYTSPDQVPSRLEEGCYVRGLYLEGAGWDNERSCLRRQDPKVLVVDLPILQVIPIEGSRLKLQNTFRTPVYVTQDRRNAMGVGLVFEADLTSDEHTSHWVLQGVCLCLNTDA